MCYVLIKIPFWVLGSIRGNHGSLIGSLIRGVIAYKTFGILSGRGGRGGRPARPQKPAAASDPYATARTDPRGQYMIPFENLRRQRPQKPPHHRGAPKAPSPRHQRGPHRQLRLPPEGEWPENKPVLQRDGQYRLAMPAPRQPRTPSAGPPEPTAKTDRSGQMVLPLGKEWPENRVRWPKPTKDGQYRLPLNVRRQPRPAEPTQRPAAQPRSQAAGRDRQLRLPLGQDWPENRPSADRTGQYRLPLNVRRQPSPRTPRPRPATQPRPRPRDRQRELPLNLPPRPHRTRSKRSSGGTP